MSTDLDRRSFLRGGLALAGGVALARVIPLVGAGTAGAQTGLASRYGELAATPDENGILLPPGFRSRELAVAGEQVPGTDYRWHPYPDGAATFPTPDGGWIYVSNSEVGYPNQGGAGALRFDAQGRVVDAYSILDGTTANCSGGTTTWGTWLSGEESDRGVVWECDPWGRKPAVARPALGVFPHECAATDDARGVVYLSEDHREGLLYRFRPDTWEDLSSGTLEAATVDPAGGVSWVPVSDPQGTQGPVRASAPGATVFPGGEGLRMQGDLLYLTTKYDDHVRRFDLASSTTTVVYPGGGVLAGVDNIEIHRSTGDLFVCEDAGNMELVWIGADGSVAPFMRWVGHDDSEVTGAAFDPSGTRLYVSSQRAPTPKTLAEAIPGTFDNRGIGRTYEITGPFVPVTTTTTTTTPKKKKKRKKKSKRNR